MWDSLFDDLLEIDAKSVETGSVNSDFLNSLPTCKGVIFFADSDGKPIQVLTAGNIRRTAKARLTYPEESSPSKRADIGSITGRIYYRRCYNNFKTGLEYGRIVKELYPDTYRALLSLPRQNFVKIRLNDKLPYFSLTENPLAAEKEKLFGPFATRRSANDYVRQLNDAYTLCRRPDLAASGNDLASCHYYQMSICPGPCMGNVPSEEYRQRVRRAISAASGSVHEQIDDFELSMKQHSEKMEFELAQQNKKSIECLTELAKYSYRWTRELGEVSVLHIDVCEKIRREKQRKKTQMFAGYLLRADRIIELGEFALDDMGSFHDAFQANRIREFDALDRRSKYENISLMSYFLYRSKPAGVWMDSFDKANNELTVEEIRKAVCRHYEIEVETDTSDQKENG